MNAYVVITREGMLDAHELAAYSKDLPASLAGHEIKVLSLDGSHEDLEGAPSEGGVIVEFPNVEAARAWCGSPTPQKRHWVEFVGSV